MKARPTALVTCSGSFYRVETYYHPKDLGRFSEIGREAPELWQKFLEWYNAVFKAGALPEREKALIALAVAHAIARASCRHRGCGRAGRGTGTTALARHRT